MVVSEGHMEGGRVGGRKGRKVVGTERRSQGEE